MWVAIHENNLDLVKYLVSKGARIETSDGSDRTSELHIAAGKGNLEMVKYLVEECGADVQQQGTLEGGGPSRKFAEVTPLWVATYKNNVDVVKYLASKGACIETTECTNRTPELHIAAGKSNLEIVKCLVEECGANIQQQGTWNHGPYSSEIRRVTPLWVATYENNLDVVKYLVSKGARIETSDGTDRISELHIAAGKSILEIVKCLVEECGANIQQQGIWKDGRYSPEFQQVTPLWVAIYKKSLRFVKYLVSKGARIDTTECTDRTPELHIAVGKGNLKIVKFLVEECGADMQQQGIWKDDRYSLNFRQVTPLWVTIYEKRMAVFKYLVSKGACIKTTECTNRTPELHIAVGKGNLEIVKCLVEECGADIQQQGIWNHGPYSPGFRQVTPLWVATYENNLDVIKYLASKGAHIETTDGTNRRIDTAYGSRERQLGDGEMLGGGVWC